MKHLFALSYKASENQSFVRLKKINAMSQSSWRIGRPDLNAFFFFFLTFFFFFFFFFSEQQQQTCQIWVGHSFENMELDFGWTRYKTEHKSWRSLLFQSVSLCLSYLFLYILTSKFMKNWKKNYASKKNSNLEFCWIKRAPKNKYAWQLWDIGFIFFSLIYLIFGFSVFEVNNNSCKLFRNGFSWRFIKLALVYKLLGKNVTFRIALVNFILSSTIPIQFIW